MCEKIIIIKSNRLINSSFDFLASQDSNRYLLSLLTY